MKKKTPKAKAASKTIVLTVDEGMVERITDRVLDGLACMMQERDKRHAEMVEQLVGLFARLKPSPDSNGELAPPSGPDLTEEQQAELAAAEALIE